MSIYLGSQPVSVYLNGTEAAVAGVYLGAVQVFPTGPSVPGVPAIDGATATNGSTVVNVFAGTADGGSPITSYEFTFNGVPVVPATVSDLSFTFNTNYALQDVRVRAVNAVGPGPYSNEFIVNT